MTLDQFAEFVTEPFDFRPGGVVLIEAHFPAPCGRGAVEFFLEGSEDKTCWAGVHAGSVSGGQRVAVPYRPQRTPWGRVRLRSFGGDARVNVRGFWEENR